MKYTWLCRFQWPRGLRLRSAAARLLILWLRIPPGTWMFVVSVVWCQVEVSATSWSFVQRFPTDCDASSCLIHKPREWRAPGPLRAVASKTNIRLLFSLHVLFAFVARHECLRCNKQFFVLDFYGLSFSVFQSTNWVNLVLNLFTVWSGSIEDSYFFRVLFLTH
jgi:hypothetical protein